jgi:uncharacterized membrane protein
MANEIIYAENSLQVISGWNEKLKMTNDQLSKFIPFVELFCIFDQSKAKTVSDERLISEGVPVTIKPLVGTEEKVTILPFFSLQAQQTSTDSNNRLLYSRGIPGIEQLMVTAESFDSNACRVNMIVSIPTLEKDIKINSALKKLLILNSDWLLMYGWAKESQGVPMFADQKTEIKIDLTSAHKGYYKVCKLILNRFDWELGRDKIATGNFEFSTEARTAVTTFDIAHYRGNIGNYLDSKPIPPSETSEQFTNAEKIYQKVEKIVIKSGISRVVEETKTNSYYSLGWVLEAIRQSLPKEIIEKNIKYINFDKFSTPKTMKIFGDKKTIRNINIPNLAYIPVPATELRTRVLDNMDDHFMWAIMEICKIASESSLGLFDVVAVMGYDGQSVYIIDLNSQLGAVTVNNAKPENVDRMTMYISAENSLIENASFSSQISKDASYALPRLINTENGRATIFSTFFEDAQLDKPKTQIGKLIQSLKVSDPNAYTLDTKNLKANFEKILKKAEDKDPGTIFYEIIDNQAMDVGLALRAYFTTLTLTIHGTALVPYATHIDFRGFIEGVDGLYWVLGSQDTLTPGDFRSTLTCTLQDPYS